MVNEAIQRLQHLCNTIPGRLSAIPEEEISLKPAEDKWSKKEILGHLIDSATNNHQRFVRAQFEAAPTIIYDQNNWNQCSHYNDLTTRHLISFWHIYNQHLIHLMICMPRQNLQRECFTGSKYPHTIGWLFNDYVQHLEHHLKQIIAYQ